MFWGAVVDEAMTWQSNGIAREAANFQAHIERSRPSEHWRRQARQAAAKGGQQRQHRERDRASQHQWGVANDHLHAIVESPTCERYMSLPPEAARAILAHMRLLRFMNAWSHGRSATVVGLLTLIRTDVLRVLLESPGSASHLRLRCSRREFRPWVMHNLGMAKLDVLMAVATMKAHAG